MNYKLLGQIRFYFAQCVFNTTCNYCAYSRLALKEKKRRYWVYSISSFTLLIIVSQLVCYQQPPENEYKDTIQTLIQILNYLSLTATASSLLFELFTKEDVTQKRLEYRYAAEEYKVLRDLFMCLIEEYMSNATKEEEARQKMFSYVQTYSSIGKGAPSTTYDDYKNTQKTLGIGDSDSEGFTWPDDQINRLLPTSLHI